jgi:hypothetical protein
VNWKCPNTVCIIIKKNNIIFVTGIDIDRRGPNIGVHNLKGVKGLMSGRLKREPNMLAKLARMARVEFRFITFEFKSG